MSEQEKQGLAKVNNHFCGLHLLVNLAEQCNAVLREFELIHLHQGDTQQSSESGTIRLIRTACKAFEKHGCEKSGKMVDFAEWSVSQGIESLHWPSFEGTVLIFCSMMRQVYTIYVTQ